MQYLEFARPRAALVQLLPGATVDVPATLTERLPAGDYVMRARLEVAGRDYTVSAPLELFGPAGKGRMTGRFAAGLKGSCLA